MAARRHAEQGRVRWLRPVWLCLALSCAGSPPPDELATCPVERELPEVPRVEAPASPIPDVERGAALFESLCARCHSRAVADRESRFFRGYPRLDCDAYLSQVSDSYLHRVISAGGPAVGLDKLMKGIAPSVPDEQIWDLIAYLRSRTNEAHRLSP